MYCSNRLGISYMARKSGDLGCDGPLNKITVLCKRCACNVATDRDPIRVPI